MMPENGLEVTPSFSTYWPLSVTDGDTLRQLQVALLDCGYEVVTDPGEEYDELGAQRILENDDGCRIDVFNGQVVDKLVLSEEMRERSQTHLEAGELTVALVSAEDIFLFESGRSTSFWKA